jgi:hypothetical protein
MPAGNQDFDGFLPGVRSAYFHAKIPIAGVPPGTCKPLRIPDPRPVCVFFLCLIIF